MRPAPPFFDAGMLRHGIYYGIREGEALVAAAGTHVLAEHEGVAAIGNVYTLRNRRGHGLGAQVSGAVTAELLRLGIPIVALNVGESNAAAIHVYRRLGFELYCDYREGIATYQGAPNPDVNLRQWPRCALPVRCALPWRDTFQPAASTAYALPAGDTREPLDSAALKLLSYPSPVTQ
jgi:RimJ/RimL family protein N-acetyltransferase